MSKFDWKAVVGSVAPAVATALGGPLAGVAVGAISKALLNKDDGNEAEIAAAIQTGGADALLKLKELDKSFAVRMRELDIDLEKINQQDRASAREREVKSGDRWTPRVLAAAIVGGFLGVVYMVLSGYVDGLKDPMVAGIVGTLIGYVSAKTDAVVMYYFGSSSGSAAKTEMMAKK